ncbi:TlpA family protein disulfide reductase [Clostridium ganghwense]|uniref:Redoxin domain-containing protein n=1 Tax=Clostridium ganghwense TaxID=312089 RepID=A0ABT4CLZ3_9CLOT|nr:TlpA disulfide reductase family protein [Clostridium ganghwense]MCY6370072.1 redoxin domain-containing protein [Clostridium ganghwense]
MKKKFLSILITALVCISIVGCGKSTDKSTQTENKTQQTENQKKASKNSHYKYSEMGFEYDIPEAWVGKEEIGPACVIPGKFGVAYIVGQIPYEFVPADHLKKLKELSKSAKTEEEQKKLYEEYKKKAKEFFTIIVLDKSKEKDGPKEDKERKEKVFSQYQHRDKVAEKDSLECYILYNDKYNEDGLSEEEKKEFKEAIKGIDEVKKSIKLFNPIDKEAKMMKHKNIEFKTKTLDGKEIDSNIFKDNKLTMVNIWATYCGPCIAEMQDLQKLYEEVKNENINLVGIVSDTYDDDENQALAKKILDKKGAKFTNIVPDEKLLNGFLKDIPGVPTTVFVDSKGNIIGKPIVGGNSKETYKKEIQERLNTLK